MYDIIKTVKDSTAQKGEKEMAQAKATCTCERCGKEFTKIAYKRNTTEARSFEQWATENITICPECWEAEQAEKVLRSYALPELTGSPKQIAWAESIRARLIEKAKTQAEKANDKDRELADAYIKHIAETKSESRFWIDNRDNNLFRIRECAEFIKERRAS